MITIVTRTKTVDWFNSLKHNVRELTTMFSFANLFVLRWKIYVVSVFGSARRWRRCRRRCRCVLSCCAKCRVRTEWLWTRPTSNQPSSLPASHPTSQPANQPASQSTSVALVPSRTIKRASTSSSATLPHAHFSFCCCGCGCDCCCVAVVAFRLAFSVALWKAARRATPAPAAAAAEATRCGLTSNPSPLFSRIRRSSSPPTPPQSYWQLNYFSAWQTKAS